MPIIGKTYFCGEQGLLKSYDHSTNIWTDKSVVTSNNFYDVTVYQSNADKIIVGGANTLSYSTNAGTTLTASVGDWSSFVPTIYKACFTSNSDIIYAVGQGGIVKSTDSGITFNRISSFTTNSGILCYAVHFATPTLGIASQTSQLYKTTNGGTSWSVLYSNSPIDPANPTDVISSVHISADGNTIVATTKRSVFRSTDGGISFTNVFTFAASPSQQGQLPKYVSLGFMYGNDNEFVLSAANGAVYKSYNAGASWISVGGVIGAFNNIIPKFGNTLYLTTEGFYSYDDLENDIHRIYKFVQTGPGTFTITMSDDYSATGYSAYAMDSVFSDSPCYQITPCTEQGNSLVVSNDLAAYVDGYVQIDSACYYVTAYLDCVNALNISYTSIQSITDCSECNAPELIYGLRDCSNELPTIYTTEDLTPGISTYLNNIVYIEGYPNSCWVVVLLGGPTEAVTVINDFKTCEECITAIPVPPPVYSLRNCLGPLHLPTLYTFNSQFAQAIELVVNLDGYPGECWIVGQEEFTNQEIVDVSIAESSQGVLQIYDNCECCLPPVEPEPVKYTRVIPKPDRKFYQITQSQCDISSNIKFAEAYYRLFKNLKYGINSQCDTVNLDNIWIKKQLSNLAVINDPTACVITTPVTPVVCPEPEGNPSYTFIIGLDNAGPATSILACTQCFDGSNPGLFQFCPQFNVILDYNILEGIDPNSIYVFSYNGDCVFTWGSSITAGYDNTLQTYTMTSQNIVNGGPTPGNPCTLCQ